ncbi:hypothetical protein IMG5_181140 [Ichthyophthirius multifiliis]|uniref:Uncharacterized protein n=1 Tax=Ichthyophthirius multifiliis TaxID=5932 RepID=G0R2X4_ICHMU|nr:hypothetical protein IMG5_181140 [Ichthyophthirius multifiliis]EGR28185.1 hypothetical protein IMG5_181140 [Ichthyophthirius multifiliis]|eukprot:XP_004027530.1 hypothetical protein IMG5_181140 [Ichthyophthirius multifiliis]
MEEVDVIILIEKFSKLNKKLTKYGILKNQNGDFEIRFISKIRKTQKQKLRSSQQRT